MNHKDTDANNMGSGDILQIHAIVDIMPVCLDMESERGLNAYSNKVGEN